MYIAPKVGGTAWQRTVLCTTGDGGQGGL